MENNDTPEPEPTSLREALARRGIEPTYWQPEDRTEKIPVLSPAVPGIEVRYLRPE
jgi:hypothetical protein